MTELERLLILSLAAVAARKALQEPRPHFRRYKLRMAATLALTVHELDKLIQGAAK